jgi:hypothetical protein
MANLNMTNPATNGPMADPMPRYGGPTNNPTNVHTSTDKRPGVPGGNKFQFNAFQPHFSKDPLKMANLNKAFLTGFCEKCAEHGVSPFQLIKQAKMDVVENPWYTSPVSQTVGQLGTPITSLFLGTTAPMGAGPGKEDVEKILKAYGSEADINVKGEDKFPLQVQLGSSNPINNIQRTWQNPNTNVLSKLYGTSMWPILETLKALTRGDSYDPFAHSIASYQKEPSVLRHELGHASDFSKRDWPGAYAALRDPRLLGQLAAIPTLFQEGNASSSAGQHSLKEKLSPDAIARMNRILTAGFGSYIAGPPGALVGQAVGALAHPWAKAPPEKEHKPKKEKHKEKAAAFADDFVGPVAGGLSGALIGALAGMPISDAMYKPTEEERRKAYLEGKPITNLLPGLLMGGGVGGVLGMGAGALVDDYTNAQAAQANSA